MNKAKRAVVITGAALSEQISRLNSSGSAPYWKVINSEVNNESILETDLKLKNFAKTWQFLNGVAKQAHVLRHHPTITTTYNKVNIQITTHDVQNRITYKDLQLAQSINSQYSEVAEIPKEIVQMNDLVKQSREHLSMFAASELINELTNTKDNDTKKN